MTLLIDQAERDRFTSTHGKNISVIAPAGVGKTHAIVRRIVTVASQPEAFAIDQLSRLIVVTYSVRAAQQMQQRAREAIRQAGLPRSVQRAFQQTFFGTIHSFCRRRAIRSRTSSTSTRRRNSTRWERRFHPVRSSPPGRCRS